MIFGKGKKRKEKKNIKFGGAPKAQAAQRI